MRQWKNELAAALHAAREARKAIMEVYQQDFAVVMKEDHSPVTKADQNADALIRQLLHQQFPTHAFLTEESQDHLDRLENPYCWIVDPVDGTKDFVAKDDEFTTNIALAYKNKIVLGVVSIPARQEIYYAVQGQGAYFIDAKGKTTAIHVNEKSEDLTMLSSRFHVSDAELDYLEKHRDLITHHEHFGSAIKACRIAHGKAELQMHIGPGTKEWDTAASQIVVEEAGGIYIDAKTHQPFLYNQKDVYHHHGFIVANRIDNIKEI